jgi:hypothetical protein
LGLPTEPWLPAEAGLFDELRVMARPAALLVDDAVGPAIAGAWWRWSAAVRPGPNPRQASWLFALAELSALLDANPDLPCCDGERLYPAALDALASSSFAKMRGWLAALSQTEAGRRALRLLAEAADPEAAVKRSRTVILASPIGGVALLLPALVESGLWRVWSAVDGVEAAHWYLYYVMLKALGRDQAQVAHSDPLLAALAGVEDLPPLEPSDLAILWRGALQDLSHRWSGTGQPLPDADHFQLGPAWLPPELDAALSTVGSLVLRRLAKGLAGFATAGPAYLARQLLIQPAELLRQPEYWQVKLGVHCA